MSSAPAATPAGDRCPRCAAPFHCGRLDSAPCACAGMTLDQEALLRLARSYRGCLCLRCLGELGQAAAADPPPQAGRMQDLA